LIPNIQIIRMGKKKSTGGTIEPEKKKAWGVKQMKMKVKVSKIKISRN